MKLWLNHNYQKIKLQLKRHLIERILKNDNLIQLAHLYCLVMAFLVEIMENTYCIECIDSKCTQNEAADQPRRLKFTGSALFNSIKQRATFSDACVHSFGFRRTDFCFGST